MNKKINNLKMMYKVAYKVNDTELLYYWLSYGIPDGAEENEFEDFANDYEEFENTFKKYMNLVSNNGGLYNATKEEYEFAKKYAPKIKNYK